MRAAEKQVVTQDGLVLLLKPKGEKKGEETENEECPESLLKYLPW